MNGSIQKRFMKYVSQNILGMIGISMYILADTYFIAKAIGADGITALNLVLPIYNVIYAIGAMIGVGSAIRFAIDKSKNRPEKDTYFVNALVWGTIVGLMFTLAGGIFPDKIVALMGGDARIVAVGTGYTRIFMLFSPCFIWNHICIAFVRNDGNPSIAMTATLFSSLFNIVFDYVLMFPLGMGMNGAALATACSPLVGVSICCIHFFSKKNTICFRLQLPSLRRLFYSVQVGVAAFVSEISSGVITVVFNMIILKLAGNIGVAAYGVVANTSLVAVSVFNGVAQGSQPLLSECYGKGQMDNVKKIRSLGIGTAVALAVLIIGIVMLGAAQITAVFNSEQNAGLAQYAQTGLRIYFIGFLFAGVNIVGAAALSAVNLAKWAFVASVTRGFIAIVICAFVLSAIFGMNGVWMAFPAAEALTMILTVMGLCKMNGFSSRNEFFKINGDE